MKVMFASGTMQGGGAERVVSILANELVTRGVEVSILVVRGPSVYQLDPRVRLLPLFSDPEFKTTIANKLRRRLVYYPRLVALIRAEKSDVIIPVHGGGWNGMFVLLAKLLGKRVIVAEHTSHTAGRGEIIRAIERLVLYRAADAAAVLTKSDLDYYGSYLSLVRLIPNPLSFSVSGHEGDVQRCTILAAGHLNRWHQKGFDNLLRVFAAISPLHPSWSLEIAGSGIAGHQFLKELSEELGINDCVQFLGFRSDIDTVMRQSAIFVLSSRIEGFGMVLLEAMSQGCACVSFDCKSGPSDIIAHEVDGLLVPDQDLDEMVTALTRLMRSKDERRKLSRAAREKARSYSVDLIVDRWIALFRELGIPAGAIVSHPNAAQRPPVCVKEKGSH